MSTAIEILEFSRDLIKNGWTRDVFAENREGQSVDVDDPDACQFCLIGAVHRSVHVLKPDLHALYAVHEALNRALPKDFLSPIKFNDAQLTEERVIDLVDRAIDSLKEPA